MAASHSIRRLHHDTPLQGGGKHGQESQSCVLLPTGRNMCRRGACSCKGKAKEFEASTQGEVRTAADGMDCQLAARHTFHPPVLRALHHVRRGVPVGHGGGGCSSQRNGARGGRWGRPLGRICRAVHLQSSRRGNAGVVVSLLLCTLSRGQQALGTCARRPLHQQGQIVGKADQGRDASQQRPPASAPCLVMVCTSMGQAIPHLVQWQRVVGCSWADCSRRERAGCSSGSGEGAGAGSVGARHCRLFGSGHRCN